MGEYTPVERHGKVWLKRDDLFEVAGAHGGKARAAWALIGACDPPPLGLVTAGSRYSPQVVYVARMAARLGLPCRAHVPAGADTPELAMARAAGAVLVPQRPGYNSVIVARARQDAEARRGWLHIPFGMEFAMDTAATAAQVGNLPADLQRLVMVVGSGMSLSGVLQGLERREFRVPVLGVVVGADPTRRLDHYAPPFWRQMVDLVPAGVPYQKTIAARVGGVLLDPHYEAKCAAFLRPEDLLWVVGISPAHDGGNET